MEMNERFLTLLTPEGEFLRAHNRHNHYQIGQEIDFFPIEIEKRKNIVPAFFQSLRGKAVFSVLLIFLLTFASILPLVGTNEVYAYMSIDVNPSIELGINDKFEVIELLAYNNAGKTVIDQLHDWKKKNIHVLTNEILQQMKMQGYIKPNREIVIATVYKAKQQGQSKLWEAEMNEIKNAINEENLELKVVEGSKEERAQAIEEGLTTGLYKTKLLNAEKPAAAQQSEKPSLKDQSKKIEQEEKKNITQNQSINQPEQQQEQKQREQRPAKQVEKGNGFDNNKSPAQNNRTQKPPAHEKKMERKENQSNNEKRWEDKDKRVPPGQNKNSENKTEKKAMNIRMIKATGNSIIKIMNIDIIKMTKKSPAESGLFVF